VRPQGIDNSEDLGIVIRKRIARHVVGRRGVVFD
jgi:hypothetical protein